MKDKITTTLDNLNPDDIQKEMIWKRINENHSVRKTPQKNKMRVIVASVIAASFIISLVSILLINSKTPVMEEDYIPDIDYINNDNLIFSNKNGTFIYDLKINKIINTVNLQEINCNYFDNDINQTCILKEKDKLIVFNTKNDEYYDFSNNKPYGYYYVYNLNSDKELICTYKGNNKNQLNNYFKKWLKHRENYKSTDDILSYDLKDDVSLLYFGYNQDSGYSRLHFNEDNDEENVTIKYSENSIGWNNNTIYSYIQYDKDEKEYSLVNYDTKAKKEYITELNLQEN